MSSTLNQSAVATDLPSLQRFPAAQHGRLGRRHNLRHRRTHDDAYCSPMGRTRQIPLPARRPRRPTCRLQSHFTTAGQSRVAGLPGIIDVATAGPGEFPGHSVTLAASARELLRSLALASFPRDLIGALQAPIDPFPLHQQSHLNDRLIAEVTRVAPLTPAADYFREGQSRFRDVVGGGLRRSCRLHLPLRALHGEYERQHDRDGASRVGVRVDRRRPPWDGRFYRLYSA